MRTVLRPSASGQCNQGGALQCNQHSLQHRLRGGVSDTTTWIETESNQQPTTADRQPNKRGGGLSKKQKKPPTTDTHTYKYNTTITIHQTLPIHHNTHKNTQKYTKIHKNNQPTKTKEKPRHRLVQPTPPPAPAPPKQGGGGGTPKQKHKICEKA